MVLGDKISYSSQRRYHRESGEQAARRQSIKRSPKLNVCCALSRHEVMGPIFFQDHELSNDVDLLEIFAAL
jgi:hypothetical protein